jgi:hypothetical protein
MSGPLAAERPVKFELAPHNELVLTAVLANKGITEAP